MNFRRTQLLLTAVGMVILGVERHGYEREFFLQVRQAGHVSLYLFDSSAHGRNDRRPVDSMIGKRNSVLRLWVSHRAAKLTQGNPQLFARAEQACLYRA